MATQEAIFINTRVRLQRLADAKFFSGWVKDFTRTDLVVKLGGPTQVKLGETFMVQVHGHSSTALFRAVLRAVGPKELTFVIPEPVRFLTASEQVRVTVEDVTATITGGGKALEATVVDLSVGGAGLVAAREIKKGEHVRVIFTTPLGNVECDAEVRYCKMESIEDGTYRIGVQLEELGRIERARWNRLVEQDAA
ncbi:MAG: PilZ domain-containing protein [Fimbriimonadaceae bacterium]|nr:PilZ domain-containing protein [Chthonomonadaceae bacterium]MCO5295539.1 PilZ domain-containing protein [Fimbriimonadaceae bacterium]